MSYHDLTQLQEMTGSFAEDLPECAVLNADWPAPEVLAFSLTVKGAVRGQGASRPC